MVICSRPHERTPPPSHVPQGLLCLPAPVAGAVEPVDDPGLPPDVEVGVEGVLLQGLRGEQLPDGREVGRVHLAVVGAEVNGNLSTQKGRDKNSVEQIRERKALFFFFFFVIVVGGEPFLAQQEAALNVVISFLFFSGATRQTLNTEFLSPFPL